MHNWHCGRAAAAILCVALAACGATREPLSTAAAPPAALPGGEPSAHLPAAAQPNGESDSEVPGVAQPNGDGAGAMPPPRAAPARPPATAGAAPPTARPGARPGDVIASAPVERADPAPTDTPRPRPRPTAAPRPPAADSPLTAGPPPSAGRSPAGVGPGDATPAASAPPAAAPAPAPGTPEADAALLRLGALAWNTPPDMRMGESKFVELRIAVDAARIPGLAERITAPGVTQTEQGRFSRVVVATLTSPAFDISPPGPQRRQLLPGMDGVWKWSIAPKQPGSHVLLLDLQSELPGGNHGEPTQKKILVRALPLQTQVLEFSLRNWDKLLTLVLIPLLAWGWKLWRDRRAAG